MIGRALRGVAALPEIVDVDVALRVGFENEERVDLVREDDGLDVLEKLPVLLRQFAHPILALAAGELARAGVLLGRLRLVVPDGVGGRGWIAALSDNVADSEQNRED